MAPKGVLAQWYNHLRYALLLVLPRVTVFSGVRKVSLTVVVPRLVAAVGTQESSGSVVCLLAVCLAVATHGVHMVAQLVH